MNFKILKILVIIAFTLSLISCSRDLNIQENTRKDGINYEDYYYREGQSLNNVILIPGGISANRYNVENIDAKNNNMAESYIIGVKNVRKFCEENSLTLNYIQSLEDTITLSNDADMESLINKLQGVESTHFFTNENGLNVDLSINITNLSDQIIDEEWAFVNILFKASIENINKDFIFKDSKLESFRLSILSKPNDLEYNVINEYVKGYFTGKYDKYIKFYNKIDNNSSEIIRIENNTIYYMYIYDPKF